MLTVAASSRRLFVSAANGPVTEQRVSDELESDGGIHFVALTMQGWRLTLDAWPDGPLMLPLAPVSAVTALTVAAGDGAPQTVDAALYETALAGDAPRLLAKPGMSLPQPATRLDGIAIDFTAGYGAAGDVPPPLKQALLLLLAQWFEDREAAAVRGLPPMVVALLAPWRRVRL